MGVAAAAQLGTITGIVIVLFAEIVYIVYLWIQIRKLRR